MEETRQIVFCVGAGEYGLDVARVNAIEALNNVVPVPNSANHILGIMNLRGEVLPVYSLRSKFGLPENATNERTKIIVTISNGVKVAFKVDAVKEILECNNENVEEFPSIVRSEDTDYVDKVANHKGRLILLLNHDKMLKEEEAHVISKLVSEVTNDTEKEEAAEEVKEEAKEEVKEKAKPKKKTKAKAEKEEKE